MTTPNRATTLADYHERITRVLLHIDRHRGEELTLDRLAAVACLSPCHFHRIFRAMVGEPLGQYVQRVRLETAVVQLQTSDRNVIEIALDAGYESAAAFTRAFEQRFGVPPSECRRAHRFELQVRATRLRNEDTMIEPEIRTRPETKVIFVRHTGPYAAVGAAWGKVCGFAARHGLVGPNHHTIGISRNDPKITAADQLRYDACVTIDRDITPTGEVGVQTIADGRYAVFMHRGPYEQFPNSYDAIFGDWLPRSGEQLRDQPCFELYINSPDSTPPAELRTEIWVPLA
jgi:AraC family transcriptional regulator